MPSAEPPVLARCPLPNRLVILTAQVVSYLHLVRQSSLLKSHVVKSSVTGPPRRQPFVSRFSERIVRTSSNPRLSCACCCCYRYPLLQVLLDVPCASFALPVVRLVHLSSRSPVPNPAFQVAHLQATPNRCYYYHFPGSHFRHPTPILLVLVALEAAPFRPQAMSLADTPPHPDPRQTEQNAPWLAPVACAFQWSSPRLPPRGNGTVRNDQPLFLRPALALAWRSSHLLKLGHRWR